VRTNGVFEIAVFVVSDVWHGLAAILPAYLKIVILLVCLNPHVSN
jgi:hypothetical protein